ncbi:TonB-dependent siderophore receptor [Jiulongibacter sediminis]|uniref:TonB-dependent receptor n=1 Tax=Jiulongibacter sediminis TaxID=1605367 RepID=A0A0N8H9E6_9BACT|nr:TonB-dependent siderophore receptor [Jiulongibacter sediminis]KPM47156.1 TonB-dependent receptor [Jiulongibacter sediminis]TBX22715.1 TonB-dependent receptor [Jiulongibacter sediminis]
MKKLLQLILLFPGLVIAQQNRIEGTVRTQDKQPAAFVSVVLKGSTIGTLTDSTGAYELNNVPEGTFKIEASIVGMKPTQQSLTLSDGQTATINFILEVDENQLNEILVTADPGKYVTDYPSVSLRLRTPLLDVPQNIQVITNQTLKDQQIFDMREGVIRNVSGATRSEHWENYARIVMRGSRVASFRNGMNVTQTWGPLTEDMSMVERIEFVKGPAGFMLAAGEPSGFYNVVTKKPTGYRKGEVSMTVGSFGTYRSTLDIDGTISRDGKLQYRLNLMGQEKGTQRPFEYNNRISVAPVLKYQINPSTSLTAEYNYQHVKMSPIGSNYIYSPNGLGDLPTDFTTLENNMSPTTIDDRSFLLILAHSLNENWKFTGQLAHLTFDQIGSSLWPSGFIGDTLQRAESIWDIQGQTRVGQFFVNGDAFTGNITHRILTGLDMGAYDFYHDWAQGGAIPGSTGFNVYNPVFGNVPSSSYPVYDRSLSLRQRGVHYSNEYMAFYAQDEIHLLKEKLRLTLAGRYTSTGNDDPYSGEVDAGKFTPRVGISYSINQNMSVYGVVDESFIPQAGAGFDGKPFDPVSGLNTEIGIKKQWLDGRWVASLAAYQITKNNVLTTDPEHQYFSVQLGQTKTSGVEFDLRGQIFNGLDVTMNYAFTDGQISEDTEEYLVGRQIPGTDRHIANAWLNYHMDRGALEGFGISMGASHAGGRTSWYSAYDTTVDPQMPSYTRFDGALSYTFDRFNVALNVNNLFNASVISGGYYSWSQFYYWQAEALRNARLSIRYKY